jgi:hypothetical protein
MKACAVLLISILTMAPASLCFAQHDDEYAKDLTVQDLSPGIVRLTWKAIPSEACNCTVTYSVFRGPNDDFTPSLKTQIASGVKITHLDTHEPALSKSNGNYYQVQVIRTTTLRVSRQPVVVLGAVVMVDGDPVPARVVAGEVLVRAEDFAKAIHATVTYSNGGMIVKTTPTEARANIPVVITPVATTGTIKGTLTYYSYGNRPDTGSMAYLLGGSVTLKSGSAIEASGDAFKAFGGGIPDQVFKLLRQTEADGNGTFEFPTVPSGSYTIITESNHSAGKDYRNKIETTHVVLKPGETFDASNDFGTTSNLR